MHAMIGARPHPVTTRQPFTNFFFLVFFLAALCTISSCALFKTSGVEGLSAEDRAFYDKYSKKFGIQFTGGENKELIRAIGQWLGAPYQLGGCSKKGVDCSCFAQMIYAQVYGIALKRSSREMFGDVRPVAAADLREGDLLFLKKPGGNISHVGIYLKQEKFAHVSTARGVIISSMQEEYYRKYFYAGGRPFNARPGITSR
jgi:hypothetical protein